MDDGCKTVGVCEIEYQCQRLTALISIKSLRVSIKWGG